MIGGLALIGFVGIVGLIALLRERADQKRTRVQLQMLIGQEPKRLRVLDVLVIVPGEKKGSFKAIPLWEFLTDCIHIYIVGFHENFLMRIQYEEVVDWRIGCRDGKPTVQITESEATSGKLAIKLDAESQPITGWDTQVIRQVLDAI